MDNPEDTPIREIEAGETIKFKGLTDKYGRAYWYVGVERVEGGVIDTVYLLPQQQPDKDKILKYEPSNEHVQYTIESGVEILRSGDRMDRVEHSKQFYCEIHDLVEDAFCMPASAEELEIREYSSGIEIKVSRS